MTAEPRSHPSPPSMLDANALPKRYHAWDATQEAALPHVTDRTTRVAGDGPGWGIAATLFAAGLTLGSLLVRSPVHERVPIGPGQRVPNPSMLQPIGQALPTLLPLYAAALSLPLFLWLARRAPLSRTRWRTTLPIWTLAVLAVALAADAILLYTLSGGVSLSRMTFYLVLLRLLTRGPPVLVAAALAHTIEHRRRARAAARDAETARAELMQAQLRTLSAQLRPHFLFNTLQSVSTLVHRDAEAADIMIGQLGDLLRASLEFGEATVIPLEDELRITEAYVGIVRERFGDRLDVAYEIDAHARGAQVPPFLLQPLVENAVEHGIEPARAGGRVVIRIARDHDKLILEVTDTGSGRSAADSPAGIGLGTTRRRLHALYGPAAHLDFSSDATAGTRVRIEMPYVAREAIA